MSNSKNTKIICIGFAFMCQHFGSGANRVQTLDSLRIEGKVLQQVPKVLSDAPYFITIILANTFLMVALTERMGPIIPQIGIFYGVGGYYVGITHLNLKHIIYITLNMLQCYLFNFFDSIFDKNNEDYHKLHNIALVAIYIAILGATSREILQKALIEATQKS